MACASEPWAEAMPKALQKQKCHERQDPQARFLPWTLRHPHHCDPSPFGPAASKGASLISGLPFSVPQLLLLQLVRDDGSIHITD